MKEKEEMASQLAAAQADKLLLQDKVGRGAVLYIDPKRSLQIALSVHP